MHGKRIANPVEARIARVARAQQGLITRAQLLAAGLGRGAVDHRLAAGRLRPVHRAVYAVGPQDLTREARWLAATLACGPGAVLSHRPAAVLLGMLPRTEGRIEVTIPAPGGRKAPHGVKLHRRPVPRSEATRKRGIPVTTVARTLLDLGATSPPRLVERALDEADYLGLLRTDALADVLARSPKRRGARTLRRILAEHAVGETRTRSELEERFLAVCRGRGLPAPRVNVEVEGFLVDFFWPQARLVVETDGYSAHRTRAAFEKDRVRGVTLRAAGYEVLRFSHRQVFGAPDWVADHVERALG